MQFHFLAKYFVRLCILTVFVSALAACSKDKVNQPTVLDPKFIDSVLVDRLWKRSVGDGDVDLKLNLSSFVVGQLVYNIDGYGYLSVVDVNTSKILWDKELSDKVSGGLGGDRKNLYYTTFQGELVSLSLKNGEQNWRVNLSSESIAKPSSNGSLVAVQTVDGKLMTFGVEDGKLRWRYDSIGPLLSLRGTPSPIISQRYTLTSFANGELLAFDNQTGQTYWKAILATPQGRTELERLVDPDGQAIIDGETLYTIAYQGKLVALDVLTGQEKWSKTNSSFNSVAFGFGQLFVTTANGTVLAINPANGSEIWKSESFKFRRLTSPFVYNQAVIFSDLDGYLHFLDINNGKYLARKQPDDSGVMGEFNVIGEKLIILTRSGDLFAYRMLSNKERIKRIIDRKLER
ncbi:MAG: outer membrane protein assembly factor BamB [Oleiphilaceae bacterium]|jgi:outer membrane protein assembly factor BamB